MVPSAIPDLLVDLSEAVLMMDDVVLMYLFCLAKVYDLKKQIDFVTSVNTDFVKEINLLKTNATISETKYLEESKINNELREKLSTLESQAVDTTELEKYKKDASNWKAVALEQLRVMAEILGLF